MVAYMTHRDLPLGWSQVTSILRWLLSQECYFLLLESQWHNKSDCPTNHNAAKHARSLASTFISSKGILPKLICSLWTSPWGTGAWNVQFSITLMCTQILWWQIEQMFTEKLFSCVWRHIWEMEKLNLNISLMAFYYFFNINFSTNMNLYAKDLFLEFKRSTFFAAKRQTDFMIPWS